MKAVHRKRLINVARALRESKEPGKFTMTAYGHPCGTPACALGHYAARADLQSAFWLAPGNERRGIDASLHCTEDAVAHLWPDDHDVRAHFGLDVDEACELFDVDGCNNAQTAIEAAEYIERWVAEREAAK